MSEINTGEICIDFFQVQLHEIDLFFGITEIESIVKFIHSEMFHFVHVIP